MLFSKKSKKSKNDVESRISEIRALGKINEKKKSNDNERLNKLLEYLKDEAPECRIAAAESLASSSKEMIVTHLCYCIKDEKDEKVIEAMKKATSSIRANIKAKN